MEDVNISKYRAQVVRAGSTPASPGFAVAEGQNPVDPSGSGQTHLPVTIATTTTGLSITESQILSGAGLVSQYIRGDGSLADFPASTGGGSSVSYYLNGSVSQGTIGGVAYKQLNRTPVFGAGTDFTINANGYIASFITDASDPNKLLIPAGNWNFETYFSASSNGGSPSFYVELYKYDGTTFTLIATSSSAPELIAFGTSLNPYYSTLAVPQTALALTDRLAIRYFVTHSGRTITLHTEDNHLCQIITTFTTGLTALNGLTAQVQNFAVGTSGTDFAIASATATHTFNLPTASATNRGALSSADWTTFNNKTSNLGTVTSVGLSSATSGVTIGSTPVTTSGTITLAIATASGSQNGLLSSTDWTTFNNKVSSQWITNGSDIYYSAGKVGINKTSPTSMLTVKANDTTIQQLRLEQDNATDGWGFLANRTTGTLNIDRYGVYATTNAFNILYTTGNVGIGTDIPNEKLQVSGAISATGTATTAFASSSTMDFLSGATRFISRGGNNSTRGSYIFKIEAADGSLSINPFVIDNGGAATFISSVSATAAYINNAAFTEGATYFDIDTFGGKKLRLNNAGNQLIMGTNGIVSIGSVGNNGSGAVLQVTGAATFSSSVTALNLDLKGTATVQGNTFAPIEFYNSGNIAAAIRPIRYNDETAADLTFWTRAYLGSITERMRIAYDGNVGIGVTSLVSPGGSRRLLQISNSTNGALIALGSSTSESNNPRIFSGQYDLGFAAGVTTGNLLFYTNDTERMRISSGGNVGIGTASPSYTFDVVKSISGDHIAQIRNSSASGFGLLVKNGDNTKSAFRVLNSTDNVVFDVYGSGNVVIQNNKIYGSGEYLGAIWNSNGGNTTWTIGDTPANQTSWNLRVNTSAAKSGGGSWGDSSDGRLKKDIKTIENALDKINKLNPVTFEWINPNEHNNQYNIGGFIAQEIKEIFPQFVNQINAEGKDKDIVGKNERVYGLTLPFKFDAYIVKSIQELYEQIQELKQKIDILKN